MVTDEDYAAEAKKLVQAYNSTIRQAEQDLRGFLTALDSLIGLAKTHGITIQSRDWGVFPPNNVFQEIDLAVIRVVKLL